MEEETEEEEEKEEEDCTEWSCELQESLCVCGERSCDPQSPPLSEEACQDLLGVYKDGFSIFPQNVK